jgi:hypothetical protein
MASVQAIKNAFVEDDDVVIPMDSGPAKRAKKGGENGVGADDRVGALPRRSGGRWTRRRKSTSRCASDGIRA